MKTVSFILSFLIVTTTFAQSDKKTELKLVGSNFSYTKGNIDVEVLTEIIQQKQKEVAQRAFENIVFGNLNAAQGANKSFTTYHYIYNVLHTITKEKNKTVITRQIVNSVLEYCLVYGFTTEFMKSAQITKDGINLKDVSSELSKNSVAGNSKEIQLKPISDKNFRVMNIYLDMAYDIFIKSDSLHKKGLFKLLEENAGLKQWYKRDNAYLVTLKINPDLLRHRELMEKAFEKFISSPSISNDLITVYEDLVDNDFKQETITQKQYNASKRILRLAINHLKNYTEHSIIGSISEYLLDYTLIEFKEETNDSTAKKRGILFIDAEGLITSLHEKFASPEKRSTISKKEWLILPKPFLILGVTHAGALYEGNKLIKDDMNSDLNNIYFANEKIGIKFTLMDKKYTRSFQPGEVYKYKGGEKKWIGPQETPLISRQELLLYGSGLLYNIANINSKQNFNYVLAGVSYGFTFFNDLSFNAGLSLPINSNNGIATNKKLMYNFSFDIPIVEYISAIRKKRG